MASRPEPFSESVLSLHGELGDGDVTAWQIIHVLLRDHPSYGGASLLPLSGRPGTRLPLEEWLTRVERLTNSEETLHGRDLIRGLAEIEPDVGDQLEPTGLLARIATAPEDDAAPVAASDPAPATEAARLDGHTDAVLAVCEITREGRPHLASASAATVRIWDPDTATQVAQLDGHTDAVGAVCEITREGRPHLASASRDRSVRIWDPDTATPVAQLDGPTDAVTAVCEITREGRPHLASASTDRSVRIWDVGNRHPGGRDRTEWHDDGPERVRDLLQRRPLAGEIARRLSRIHGETRPPGSFVVHLDGPWGAGKSTLLGYLAGGLPDPDGWLVVEVNAWRERRVRPAWFTLLTRLRASLAASLPLDRRIELWFAEQVQRARIAGPGLALALALTAAGLVAVGAVAITGGDLKAAIDSVAGKVTALTGFVALVFGLGAAVGRTLFWGSAGGARWFERANPDPMEAVAKHVEWLLSYHARMDRRPRGDFIASLLRPPPARSAPVLFLIDDLDRCDAEYAIEMLEAIQNLVRDRGPRDAAGGRRGPYFVVAADGAWLRQCYEKIYGDFDEAVSEPGRPLGHLFCDKLFQLTVEVPRLTAERRRAYLNGLLGARGPGRAAVDVRKARTRVQRAGSEQEVIAAVREASSASPDAQAQLVAAAVSRLSSKQVEIETEHALSVYAPHLPGNPRAMKRFVNAYGMARAVHLLELNTIEMGPRAIWTLLRLRWPLLADAIRDHPAVVDHAVGSTLNPTAASRMIGPELADLLVSEDVRSLLVAPGGPLTADMVRRLAGQVTPTA